MNSERVFALLAVTALCWHAQPSAGASLTIDFEELPLSGGDYYNGADGAGGFEAGGAHFANEYEPFYGAWSGWAYSRVVDVTTPGPTNQYAAYPGAGAGGSSVYALTFNDPSDPSATPPEITLPDGAEPASLAIANTTYAALSMLRGDPFAKKFGGPSGVDPDWFRATIVGLDDQRAPLGQVEVYLADYRFPDPADDYVLDDWLTVDLSPLAGIGVRRLEVRFASTDNGDFGMNTPAYAAIDDLVLSTGSSHMPGDHNGDGVVDAADYAAWRDGLGRTTTASGYFAWREAYGAAQALGGLAVPGPGSASLAVFLLFCRRRRRT